MTGAEIREKFLSYFERRGHTRLPSSSLIPSGDATLLFTNAGMVQFKSVLTGVEKLPFNRATTSQKCLRVSGKHNDLENVGNTARHHTFFEMLGNFSFGDYFKKDAIAFGWEFLTNDIGLAKKDLHVTIFTDDDEANDIWLKVLGKGANPIQRLGEKDNFWSMGDTGPCGPCSEIHIDQGPSLGCGNPDCSPACDCDRYLELWNLVFMQFNRDASGVMTPLPKPSIDTGLGLERLAAVAQGVPSNWESDLFIPIIHHIESISRKRCAGTSLDAVAIRVIADHSRAAAFLIADGVMPSNEGRGYVLRRILRRALRYGKYIGLNEPFMFTASDVVIDHMRESYPELGLHKSLIDKVILNEEQRFLETLARGISLFEEAAEHVKGRGETILPGELVFKLYDTFGFPPDLTADMARENNLNIDVLGFEREMSHQKKLARQAWDTGQTEDRSLFRALAESGASTEFTGYATTEDTGTIIAIIINGEAAESAQAGDTVEIVTDRTPFYAESGGQVGDHGIISNNGAVAEIVGTGRPLANITFHKGILRSGVIRVNDRVRLEVRNEMRRAIMANHSATHILQAALRETLGDHVKQSGSLVDEKRLRFDFTHFSTISLEEILHIENYVNERIWFNIPIVSEELSLNEALQRGATALFGEKYGSAVRMISMGDFSKELCGGTHAQRTGDLGLFKIVSDSGIAAGVRRIEAVTGPGALEYVRETEVELKDLAQRLKAGRGELVHKVDKLIEEKKAKEREVDSLKVKLTSGVTSNVMAGVQEIEGIKVIRKIVDDISNPKDLREYADRLRDKLDSGVALIGAKVDGKALLLAVVTKDLTKRFHAGNIVKRAAEAVGGSGGGRPDMAQAGGPNLEAIDKALKTLDHFFGA